MIHIFRKSLLWTAILYLCFVLIQFLIGMVRTYFYQPDIGYTVYAPEESTISNVVVFGAAHSIWLKVALIGSLFLVIFILQSIRIKRKGRA